MSNPPRGPNDQKKFDLDQNFQSRSKFLISLENFDLVVSISPQKIGPWWVARSKISFSIEIFNLDRNLEFFDLWALWAGCVQLAGYLVNLFLLKLVRISGFSPLFS